MKKIEDIKVLVVDDYKAMVRIITNILRSIGFREIDNAYDGSEAIQKMKVDCYDIVISDLEMEPLSGLSFLRWVREDSLSKETPFILMGADADMDTIMAAKRAKVSSYIRKPFSADDIASKINFSLKQLK